MLEQSKRRSANSCVPNGERTSSIGVVRSGLWLVRLNTMSRVRLDQPVREDDVDYQARLSADARLATRSRPTVVELKTLEGKERALDDVLPAQSNCVVLLLARSPEEDLGGDDDVAAVL
jgi:hypothetical protein